MARALKIGMDNVVVGGGAITEKISALGSILGNLSLVE